MNLNYPEYVQYMDLLENADLCRRYAYMDDLHICDTHSFYVDPDGFCLGCGFGQTSEKILEEIEEFHNNHKQR